MTDIVKFIAEQCASWELLDKNIRSMLASRRRIVQTKGGPVLLQCNPDRIRSTCADVSAKGVAARACFLCPDTRLKGQVGFRWRSYEVLANPYPIITNHLTIVAAEHIPQRILPHLDDFLALAEYLEGYTVLYNAPMSGASAPDHMHFQAGDGDDLLMWKDTPAVKAWYKGVDASLFTGLRRHIRLEGSDAETVGSLTRRVISLFPSEWLKNLATQDGRLDCSDEPEWNGFCRFKDGKYAIEIFPRTFRRPQCYFLEEPDRILTSPGALDMAGILVMPRESDYNKVTAEQAFDIYDQVSPSPEAMKEIFMGIFKAGS